MNDDKVKMGVACLIGATAALASMALMRMVTSGSSQPEETPKPAQPEKKKEENKSFVAVIGDVGGTNVRLTLKRFCLQTRTSTEILPMTKIPSQGVQNFAEALSIFLKDFDRGSESWPRVGVIGIAGEVKNNSVITTNIPHWNRTDGKSIAQEFGMESFELVNDFVAAGHGLIQLHEKDYDKLDNNAIEDGGVKVVIGPGTGHGQGVLIKSKFAPCYEVYPTEGGHVEFPSRSEEDWKLMNFGKEYVEKSNNIENERGKGKVNRMSYERMAAGPAIPLIYEFMKKEHPDMECILEKGDDAKTPDEINSHNIVQAAMIRKDPLCMKVVNKFAELFAVKTGDTAINYLPYGGIYLTGGVTMGIRDLLLHDETWMNTVRDKGRYVEIVSKFPIMLIKPDVELGILGAEEIAFRLCDSYS